MVIFGCAYYNHTPTSISNFIWAYAIDNAYHSYLVCQTAMALPYANDNDNNSHYYSRGWGGLTGRRYVYVPT